LPNGKPGDHPYTDVVVHGAKRFGEPIDGLLRQLAKTGGCPDDLSLLLFENDPSFRDVKVDRAKVESAIRRVLAERQGGTGGVT
jgi:hypothetical protein